MTRPPCPQYDPELDKLSPQAVRSLCEQATGLDKLQFVNDPVYRKCLYELYFVAHRNERDPRIIRDEQAREAERREQEFLRRAQLALQGKLGKTPSEREEAQRCAEELMPMDRRTGRRQQDPSLMRQLDVALKEIRNAHNYEPSGGFDEMGGMA